MILSERIARGVRRYFRNYALLKLQNTGIWYWSGGHHRDWDYLDQPGHHFCKITCQGLLGQVPVFSGWIVRRQKQSVKLD